MSRRWNEYTGPAKYDPPEFGFWDVELPDASRRLLNSAVMCFARSGFHGTKTREISTGAGLSPAALYVRFESKEAVLFEIIRTGHARSLAALVSHPQTGDPVDRLRQLVAIYVEWHARYHTVARVCHHELAALTKEHFAQIVDLRHQIQQVFRAVVEEGVADNTFDAENIHAALRAILSLSIDVVRWYGMDGVESPESLAASYSKLAIRMITPETAAAH